MNAPSSLPVEVFRKMVESSFHHTDIKVAIYKKDAHREVQPKRNRNSYAYVVQSDNKCASDTDIKTFITHLKMSKKRSSQEA